MNLVSLRFSLSVVCCSLLLSLGIFGCEQRAGAEVAIKMTEQVIATADFLTLQIQNYEISLAYAETKMYEQVKEKIEGWQVYRGKEQYGFLSLHQYLLANGDHYYFLRYLPELDTQEELVLFLPLAFSNFEYRTLEYPQGLDFTKSVWSEPKKAQVGKANRVEVNLPVNSVYIDDEQSSYFFSYVDVFLRQTNAVKQELYKLARPIQATEEGLELHFPHLKAGLVEQWGLISSEPLVDWKNQAALVELRIADLNRVRKWGQEGSFYLTPASYTPSSATSFYMNPAHHIGEKFLRSEGARFFEDFALISLHTAARTQNKHGYWYMTNQSDWLYKDYGLPSTYYDTRFSTDAALFLIRGYQRYQEPVFLEAARQYADFLLQFASEHHFKTKNGGYLIWDYGHDYRPRTATHVSLNHLVTEMNFLYELYQVTEEAKYLELAHKIKLAVQDTAPKWKKPNGDLWYAYLVNGGYGLQDYPLLTLKDLRYSQRLFAEVDGVEDADFANLIQFKEAYLKRNNLPLY